MGRKSQSLSLLTNVSLDTHSQGKGTNQQNSLTLSTPSQTQHFNPNLEAIDYLLRHAKDGIYRFHLTANGL